MAITLKPLAEQVVVVVGCSSGIGRLAAHRLAASGARLVLSARDPDALAEVLDDVRAHGATDAVAVPADVVIPDDLDRVARTAMDAFGRLDTWVQLAAVSLYAEFEKTTPHEFRRVIEVNLLGQAYGAMAALPRLRQTGSGALIEISSVEAEVPLPYQSAYAASKHGMAGFLRSLRAELQGEGVPIAVTQILPSGIDTPLFDNARSRIGVRPRPAPPVYDPNVVVDLILYAAAHPSGDLYAGGGGWALAITRRLSPRAVEIVLARLGRRVQRSDEPRSEAAADNLEAPLAATDQVRGGFSGRRRSVATWLQTHPGASRAAAGAATIGGLLLLRRPWGRGRATEEDGTTG